MRALVPLALAASLCLPCSAWDDEDSLGNPNSTRRNQTAGFGQKAANNSFGYQQRTPAGLESAAESNARRERKHREFTERTRRMNEEQDRQWAKLRDRRETENNAHEARQWRNVETVVGAFVATGPYYKSGNKMVITDKGLVYAVGNDGVVAPDGYYYRSGNFWVGPDNKGGSVSGSGNNEFIAGGSQGSAIGVDRGFFTERGYSWPAYPKSSLERPSWCSR
jgi:hypothetical protein